MTPPLLEEFLEQLSKVKRKPSVLAYDLICLSSGIAYSQLFRMAESHPEWVTFDYRYHLSPMRVSGVSVILVEHMTSPNFKFAQMISVCANGKCVT